MGITDGNCGYKPSFFRTHIFLPQSRRICLTHLSWILGVMPPWVRSPMPFRPPPPSLILSLYSVVPRRVRHPSFSTPTSCASLQTSRVVGSTFTLRLAVVFGPPLLPYPNPPSVGSRGWLPYPPLPRCSFLEKRAFGERNVEGAIRQTHW